MTFKKLIFFYPLNQVPPLKKRSRILGLQIPILFNFFAQVLLDDNHLLPLSMVLTFNCSQVYLFYRSVYAIIIMSFDSLSRVIMW